MTIRQAHGSVCGAQTDKPLPTSWSRYRWGMKALRRIHGGSLPTAADPALGGAAISTVLRSTIDTGTQRQLFLYRVDRPHRNLIGDRYHAFAL